MFVKICGITNEADALMAVAMGADALGFVFAPSSRRVGPDDVRDIVRHVPDEVLTVGVFRDESAQRIVELVTSTGLGGVQLHGRESPGEATWIKARVPFVVQAFAAGDPRLERVDDYDVDAVLLDAAVPGSGTTFDWSLVGDLPRRRRVLLAGGLDPENVAEAIRAVDPWGVDVSSGVERGPGLKDVRRVRRFIAEARAAGDGPGTEPSVDPPGIFDEASPT
ncbi:phosphoribosylanthranilate isomerase [Rhabdothermincola salaria]|uniref:phosphoribosylanthranilate isomerase n=1 Tax=Rhabdothermincola salaria TaxID=2903142 RepID=UPI001E428975|nr:phosphoribosylanthranilate isomerase [Rhabdothermincola salaria]MCD9622547.1 phosphoribosylanthranilate isomerase [Rhabdothermincola salaria]